MFPMDTPDNQTTRRGFLGKAALTGVAMASVGGTAAASKGGSTTPTKDVTFIEGVTYASRPSTELKVDLYLPESKTPTPLVVWIHGGGWLAGNRKSSPDLRQYYASRGIAMATIDYRLSHEAIFPAQIEDVKAAIRWLRGNDAQYNLDPNHVATWGSSAGAHLAALAATVDDVAEVEGDDIYEITPSVEPDESGTVQAAIPWYPPTDLLEMDTQDSNDDGAQGIIDHDDAGSPESLLIGEPIQNVPEKTDRANPITYIDSDDPPFLFMHGKQDRLVPYEQSRVMYQALRDECIEATFYNLHNLGHGFGFDELTQKPVIEQTIHKTQACKQGPGKGSPPGDHTTNGPPAGPKVIEQFIDQHLTD